MCARYEPNWSFRMPVEADEENHIVARPEPAQNSHEARFRKHLKGVVNRKNHLCRARPFF